MPETALGHARLARRADLAFCPLDFECYRRAFKIQISGARFRDRRFWLGRSATEAGRRCRIATPLPLSHSTCATNAGLTAWVAWGALVAKRASGRPDPQGRLGRVGRCGRRAARVNWRLQRESESITRRVQRPAPPRPPKGRLVQAGRWSPARSLWVAGLERRACGAIWVGQGDPGGVSALLRAFYSLCCA